MDFSNIHLSKFEIDILKTLQFYNSANKYQLHGYFKFPNFDNILISVHNLEKLNLIYKSEFEKSYKLTIEGERYIEFNKRIVRHNRLKFISIILGVIASILAIVEFFR